MTRINANIKVCELTDTHLLAEHREIKRVCSRYKNRLDNNKDIEQTHSFTLGKGHELFFIDKGLFTYNRYKKIREECINRGFNVSDFSDNWNVYKPEHMVDYIFKTSENDIIRDRIRDRINSTNAKLKYKSKDITKEDSINLLKFGE